MSTTDHGLEVLMRVRERVAPDLSPDLLRKCYEVQVEYLFDDDETKPSTKMEKLVNLEVDRKMEEDRP